MAKPAKTTPTPGGSRGRKGMSPEEKAKKEAEREAFKAMTPEQKDVVRAANFKRLGTPRLKAAIAVIRRLGNLAGSNYRSTPDQIAKIKSGLMGAVTDTLARLERTEKADEPAIEL